MAVAPARPHGGGPAVTVSDLKTLTLTHAGAMLNRTWTLPIAVVCPTNRCHSRCLSCAWWATGGDNEMTVAEWTAIAVALRAMGTRVAVFSGGEPLLREDVWAIARAFADRGIVLHLLTSGLALKRHARQVAQHFARVVVSLDGATSGQYRMIRGVDGFSAVADGVDCLRVVNPSVRVTARATLHRANFRDMTPLLDAAMALGVQHLSFLAADLVSSAFGPRDAASIAALSLTAGDVGEFREVVERLIADRPEAFTSGFIAESPDRLRRLPQYFAACLGHTAFPVNHCNAPSVSVVIDADGAVRPCFFHAPVGNVRERRLREIVTSDLAAFRKAWQPATDPICERCVCTLKLGWGAPPWS
jgi:MoaA/NifB/PqqE/SkfB family radical SAM enzyme